MYLLRYLKVLSATVCSVALVVALLVFVLVPREALVDFLPGLEGLLPPPVEKSRTAGPKPTTLATAKEPESPVAVPGDGAKTSPPEESEHNLQTEPKTLPAPATEGAPVEVAEPPLDLDDPEAVEEIAAGATDFDGLLVRKNRGVETASGKAGPYTGWAKRISSKPDGQLLELGRYEDGLRDGLWVEWAKNGQKRLQGQYKNGRQDGVWTHWKSNGAIAKEFTYEDGKKSRDPIKRRLDARRLNVRELLDSRRPFRQRPIPRK